MKTLVLLALLYSASLGYAQSVAVPGALVTVVREGAQHSVPYEVAMRRALREPARPITQPRTTPPREWLGCGTDAQIPASVRTRINTLVLEASKQTEQLQSADTLTVTLAVEIDHQLAEILGTEAAATKYVSGLIGQLSATYERDMHVRIRLANLRIWMDANDPYADDESVFSLLGEFVRLYRTTMTGVPRSVAMLLTGRGGMGGIAHTIGGLCDEDGSYCAADVTGVLGDPGEWAWDAGVAAHELGHVLGGIHTQSCYWPTGPLDSCVGGESGDCLDETRPAAGTIMSYCHQQLGSGGSMTMKFHPLHTIVLRSYVENALCVGAVPSPGTSILTGRAIDATTGEPIPNIPLTVSAIQSELYRNSPPPQGDTMVVADANGYFRFDGLGHGLYAVTSTPPWIEYPTMMGQEMYANTTMIAGDSVSTTVRFVRGRRVELRIANQADTTRITLNLYSTVLPGAMSNTRVGGPTNQADTVVQSSTVPVGRYIVVPSAVGRRFQPNMLDVTVEEGTEPLLVEFTSTSTLPNRTATLSVGHVVRTEVNGRQFFTFKGGAPFVLTNQESDNEPIRGTIAENGVAVVENLDALDMYTVSATIDTATAAPLNSTGWLLPEYDVTQALIIEVPRRFPTIVRPLAFNASVDTYNDLEGLSPLPDVLTRGSARLELPFAITMADREMTVVQVHRNGYVAFAPSPFPMWATTPIAMSTTGELVACALCTELYPDTAAQARGMVLWGVVGQAPDRRFVVQWSNMMARWYDWDNGRAEDHGRFSFRAEIHESGRVVYLYDAPGNFYKMVSTQIGLRGSDVMDHALLAKYGTTGVDVRSVFEMGASSFVPLSSASDIPKGLRYEWKPLTSSTDDRSMAGMDDDIEVFPMPASERITVRSTMEMSRLIVVDAVGRVVVVVPAAGYSASVNAVALAGGRYMVLVDTQRGRVARPLVIQR